MRQRIQQVKEISRVVQTAITLSLFCSTITLSLWFCRGLSGQVYLEEITIFIRMASDIQEENNNTHQQRWMSECTTIQGFEQSRRTQTIISEIPCVCHTACASETYQNISRSCLSHIPWCGNLLGTVNMHGRLGKNVSCDLHMNI